MRYRYSKKHKRVAHIIHEDSGRTFCQIEKSTFKPKQTLESDSAPAGRKICSMCEELQAKGHRPGDRSRSEVFYGSWEWKKLRFETLKHYGARCMLCNSMDNICVDHIKPRGRYPELELDPENVQVLCDECNRGKAGDDETDFRPLLAEPELDDEQEEHLRTILQ